MDYRSGEPSAGGLGVPDERLELRCRKEVLGDRKAERVTDGSDRAEPTGSSESLSEDSGAAAQYVIAESARHVADQFGACEMRS